MGRTMIPVATKRYSAVLVLGVSIGTLLAADPRYIPPPKNAPATKNSAPTKAEVDRKIAESKRKI